jgi:16S rRNA (guanine527-N7)-methyltransferase
VKQHNLSYHDVSRETFTSINQHIRRHQVKIESFLDQLFWWNQRVNLVSRNVSRETLMEHVRHSLLLSEIPVFDRANFIIDAGTGGGLPGIPLAITNPEKIFLLIDVVRKKTMAVKQIARKLSINNISVKNVSVENIEIKQPFFLVSKHAFKIDELYQMLPSSNWEYMAFFKGTDYEKGLQKIKTPLNVDIYQLYRNNCSDFYQNKVIMVISRAPV